MVDDIPQKVIASPLKRRKQKKVRKSKSSKGCEESEGRKESLQYKSMMLIGLFILYQMDSGLGNITVNVF